MNCGGDIVLRGGGVLCFFFQAEDGIRDLVRSRGLGDVYKRQLPAWQIAYGILYASLWVVVGCFISQRAFYRFVVTKEGVRRK